MTAAPLSWQKSRPARLGRALLLAAGLAASPAVAADTAGSSLAVGANVVETCVVSTRAPTRPASALSCANASAASLIVARHAAPGTFRDSAGERRASAAPTHTPADSGNVTYVTITY